MEADDQWVSAGWLATPERLAFDRSGAAALELVEAPELPELSEVLFAPKC